MKKEETDSEMDRHRVIVAKAVSDFFLFLLKHFKRNHIVQFIYLSNLIYDANGVLVMLKFFNQELNKVNVSNEIFFAMIR